MPRSLATFRANPRSRLLLRVLLPAVAVLMAGSLHPTSLAHAQAVPVAAEPVSLRIGAGPLGVALEQFARATGANISYNAQLVNGLATQGVDGSHGVAAGLRILLTGTGMEAVEQPGGGFLLRKAPVGVGTLPAVTVSAQTETATGPVPGYAARRSATGTKTDTPLREVPASVQVVSREVIDDQKALSLRDVYENISGVQASGNTLNAQTEVLPIIRGFESPSLMRNGLRATYVGAVDMINIERVEVLKGPASILYGALEPGGIVNYVTKRPQDASSQVFEQQIGSDNFRRTSGDLTGRIDEQGSWLYRLNFARTDSDSFRDEMHLERTAIAPSFLWRSSADTELLLDFSYIKEKQPYDAGIPMDANGRPLAAKTAFFNDPDLAGRSNEDYYAAYQLTHAIGPTWSLRNQFQFHRARNKNETLRPRGISGNNLLMRYQNEDREDDELQFVLDAIGKFSIGSIAHTLLIGAEYVKQETDWLRFRANAPAVAIDDHPVVDYTPPANQTFGVDLGQTLWKSLYVQDQLSLLEGGRLKLLIGGRFDDVTTQSRSDGTAAPDVEDRAFTGRGGLLYQLTPRHSAYLSVSQSFTPQQGSTVDANGDPLDPERGEQYEAGVKSAFLDEQLFLTVAVYQIEKKDVAVFDQDLYDTTGQSAYFSGVRQQSRGVEFDLAGNLTRRLKVSASYGYVDTEVLANAGDPAQVGRPLPGMSPHTARLWLAYTSDRSGPLGGLGVGGGARYVGKSTAQADVNLELPAYTVADAGVWYQWSRVRASLNVRNLFDEDYISRASTSAIAHPGAPRTVTAAASISF